MNQITIDLTDTHAMERLAASQNAVALIRYHNEDPSFTAAHAQTALAIYTNLTLLADGQLFTGGNFAQIPGGNEYSVKSNKPQVTAAAAATVAAAAKSERDQAVNQEDVIRQMERDAAAKAAEVAQDRNSSDRSVTAAAATADQ